MTTQIPVMILAAGLGTRLAPLSSWRAKALVPIGDRPALAHLVERVKGVARGIVVNAHHRADEVEAFARSITPALAVSREADLLGTAGGVHAAAAMLGAGDVLVWNGDMEGALDVTKLVESHERARVKGARATLAIRPCEPGARGNVGLDEDGAVVRLRGETATAVKMRKPETRAAEFVGVHVLGEELRRLLPRAGCLVGDVYLPAMRRGERLASMVIDAEMIDIGTPREYLRANLRWLATRGERAWCGDGAKVAEGVTLDGAIVGEGARVVGVGAVESCVVWPGAEARAPIVNAIVTPDGVVHVPPPR